MQKKKQEISSILLKVFLILTIFIGGAIYALPKYLFIDADIEFDPADSSQAVVAVKANKLKLPDLSLFESDKFQSLEKGYWDVLDESTFELGNKEPFKKIDLKINIDDVNDLK